MLDMGGDDLKNITVSKGDSSYDSIQIYLKEIGQYPLIPASQEKELAKRIEKADEEAKSLLAKANLRLVVSGKFKARADFQSDSGRVVQYRLMSYSRKIAGDITFPKLEHRISGSNNAWNIFVNIKKKFIRTLNELFIAPASGLLAGIIIGDTSSLDNNLLDVFRAVGLIHIVVLSGYNITLVANFFVRMFAPLGYYRRLITAMIALIFFIAVVGISQTALRAGIMALCAFAARYYIRPYVVSRGIFLALLIMVWISPYALLFDLSLQLSFLATFGIVFIFPLISKKFPHLAENNFGEILLQTVAVNIVTLPIIIYQMGYFSLISFPINIAVLGFVPWITVLGFLAVFIGMIIGSLGKLIAFPVQIIVDVIIRITTWAAENDPFKLSFPTFSLFWLLGIYVIILFIVISKLKNSKKF
jgi:competence protein ComEC